ncbi:hypothetical protein FOL46_006563, partial [Perkinsus olseni]
ASPPDQGRQDSFVLAKEQVNINRTLTNPKATVSDLIKVAKTNRLMFNTVNWATLFHRLARFHAKEAATNHRAEIQTLLHQCRLEEDCSCQHLANLSWAMAKLRIVEMPLLRTVVEKSLAMSQLMNPPDVTNLCWSLAKSRSFLDQPWQSHELEEIVNDMFSYVVGRIRLSGESFLKGFKPVELSSVMWAIAAIRDMSASVMEGFSEVCDITAGFCVAHLPVETFPPASLASLAWALSQGRDETIKNKSSRRTPGALSVLMRRSSEYLCSRGRLLFKLKAKDLSELLWAIVGSGAYHSIELVLRTSQKPFDASAVPGLFRASAWAAQLASTEGSTKSSGAAAGRPSEPNSCSSISTATSTESGSWCPMSRQLFEKLLDVVCDAGVECCLGGEKNHLPESLVMLLNHFNVANESAADGRECFDKCARLAQLLDEDFLAREGTGWSPHGALELVELTALTRLDSRRIIAAFKLLYVADSSGYELKWQSIEATIVALEAGASITRRSLARLAFLATYSAINTYRLLPPGLLELLCPPLDHADSSIRKDIDDDGDDASLSRLVCALSRSDSTRGDEVLAERLCELVEDKDERRWSGLHTVAVVQGLDRMSPRMLPSFVSANLVSISQRLEELSKSISPAEKVLAEMTLEIVIRVVGSDRPSFLDQPRSLRPLMF